MKLFYPLLCALCSQVASITCSTSPLLLRSSLRLSRLSRNKIRLCLPLSVLEGEDWWPAPGIVLIMEQVPGKCLLLSNLHVCLPCALRGSMATEKRLAEQTLTSHLTSLRLMPLICKITRITPTSGTLFTFNQVVKVKHINIYLAHSKRSLNADSRLCFLPNK